MKYVPNAPLRGSVHRLTGNLAIAAKIKCPDYVRLHKYAEDDSPPADWISLPDAQAAHARNPWLIWTMIHTGNMPANLFPIEA